MLERSGANKGMGAGLGMLLEGVRGQTYRNMLKYAAAACAWAAWRRRLVGFSREPSTPDATGPVSQQVVAARVVV